MPSSAFRIHGAGGAAALVSLAAASQFLKPAKVPVVYYGLSGDDAPASRLRHMLAQTPLDLTCFRQRTGRSPHEIIEVEARIQGRILDVQFAPDPGTVQCDPALFGESFSQAAFNVYAGTAPLSILHAALPDMLAKGHHRGAVNIVGKVFDYAAEKLTTGQRWTLSGTELCPHIDLLVTNGKEVRNLTGLADVEEAVDYLVRQGLLAAIVTQGAEPVYYRSEGGPFGRSRGYVPVSPDLIALVSERKLNSGLTIGAGENFLAGLLTDFMLQVLADDFYPKGEVHIERELLQTCPLRLRHAIEFAVVAGSLACLQPVGLLIEKARGERLALVRKYFPDTAPAGRPW